MKIANTRPANPRRALASCRIGGVALAALFAAPLMPQVSALPMLICEQMGSTALNDEAVSVIEAAMDTST